ncbi:hypothetical protein Bbelb_269680 [Branchiostoma belcheri]|nr:hypothetical protein Bbelb_269680 [Branchiostoma belcheri]
MGSALQYLALSHGYNRTCFCVLSTCKNVGKRRTSVRGEYRLRTESYRFGSTQTRRRTLSAQKIFVRSTDSPPVRASTSNALDPYMLCGRSTCEYGLLTVKLQSHRDHTYVQLTYHLCNVRCTPGL